MNRIVSVLVVVVGVVAVTAVAGATAPAGKAKAAGGSVQTMNCGEAMKAIIPLPTKFGELMTSISAGMEAHAAWAASSKDPAAQAEAAAIKKVAADHAQVAAQMKQIVADLEAASKLAPAPHDMSKADPKGPEGMLKSATLEREMAALMIKHAEETEKKVKEMQKGAPAAK